ncbi:DUF4226 domain-containing protein [Nocardia colli]|uniref:DUF4226 domain-containing protein n=1 Tax=Nocardia colli TaxID=2545717 RepID=A0A5N0DYX1_9NOCA|nr:DUF4226 domain-containing protein [Nocardia colli]KAA8881896.1 DUF4226 domain-containing protein [Nocardia colli]
MSEEPPVTPWSARGEGEDDIASVRVGGPETGALAAGVAVGPTGLSAGLRVQAPVQPGHPAPQVPPPAAAPRGDAPRVDCPPAPTLPLAPNNSAPPSLLPPIDPETIAAFAPAATAVASALPFIAMALTGLTGNGAGLGGLGNGLGSGYSPGFGSALGGRNGNTLTPQQLHALGVLEKLAQVYGDDTTTDPDIAALRHRLHLPTAGGSTNAAIRARRLFQANAANAFNDLDNQLAAYLQHLAGTSAVDRNAVTTLVRETNAALIALGPRAYTTAGQQQVHAILTAALHKAQTVITATTADATETAAAINQLTNQYLHNITGHTLAGRGATPAARQAIATALAQIGKPYVYGAEGPGEFDCSGLMQYCVAAAGGTIPRVAADQYRTLPKVNPTQIRPGDLVFPTDSFDGDGASHVMMYVGNGKCIEAPQSGSVVHQRSLPSSFRATRWA